MAAARAAQRSASQCRRRPQAARAPAAQAPAPRARRAAARGPAPAGLEQRHLDLSAWRWSPCGVFLAFPLYLGWDGGRRATAVVDGLALARRRASLRRAGRR